jgi:excinuclease UvrABC ATPase subunit
LERVLDNGRNTIVMVEHDLQLIRSADWVLDFGPGSGPDGGKIVFAGVPAQLARTRTPTGQALAGKLLTPNGVVPDVTAATARRSLSPREQAGRAAALFRTLISGDASGTAESGDGPIEPIVIVSERFWSGRNNWELAGLDCEIPKLLLDVQRASKTDVFTELLVNWEKDRSCWLAIQPFLTDMQTWETELPETVIRTVSSHLPKEGLRLVMTNGEAVHKQFDVRYVRATGTRFVSNEDSEEGRHRALRDAFSVGGGYVELRDRGGRLRAIATNRLLDLETAIIAPMVPVPSHFSRLDPRGRCPMCKGSRSVTSLSESYVIGNPAVPLESDRFLTSEANAVMKGIRHNELSPFLRRLALEGLWNPRTSFERLDSTKRDLILFGFWSRPGPGSFLKSPKADASEVASWLRWDGLYRHVLQQADRSHNTGWAHQVRESARPVRCPLCSGSGLRRFANLLRVAETSFAEWTRLSDGRAMLRALESVQPNAPRQRDTLQRILYSLAPLGSLNQAPAAIVERCVESFTTMAAIELGEADGD